MKLNNLLEVVWFIDELGCNVFFVDGICGVGKIIFINSLVECLNNDKCDMYISIRCFLIIDFIKLFCYEFILVIVMVCFNKVVFIKLKENWLLNYY